MNHTKKTPSIIDRVFKNKDGKWVIIQFPNLLLSVWIILLLLNALMHNQHIRLLQSAVLFAWAYLELTKGESYFRKSLGAVILIGVTVSFFM